MPDVELAMTSKRMRLLVLGTLTLSLGSCTQQPERWISSTIDDRPTSSFRLVTRGGEVVGGHDGCNGWAVSDQPGLITMDAQECPPDPMRDAYWSLARSNGTTRHREGDKLVARAGGHIGVFVRR
jgi:hypothetical protein